MNIIRYNIHLKKKYMFQKIIDLTKQILHKLQSITFSKSNHRIAAMHRYRHYKDYVNHQIKKTTDPERVEKWLSDEWESKVTGFKEIFTRNQIYIQGKQNALCLGSRTGQEVKALLDIGITAIGIDLVPFPPYTIEGDIHELKFMDEEFDLIFTNIFDHSLFPKKFCSEMERVCKTGGIIIIHLLLGEDHDEFTETMVFDPEKVIAMFKSIEIKESREISNSIDILNWELILEKSKRII